MGEDHLGGAEGGLGAGAWGVAKSDWITGGGGIWKVMRWPVSGCVMARVVAARRSGDLSSLALP